MELLVGLAVVVAVFAVYAMLGKKEQPEEWRDVPFEIKHPGSEWVNLSKGIGGQCKLVSISQLGHQPIRLALARSLAENLPYDIRAEREPDNPHDPNAVRIVFSGEKDSGVAGFVQKDVAKDLASRFTADMPIKVMARRLRNLVGTDSYYIEVMLLIPRKKDRAPYER
jgi:hypothetical protein